MKFILYNFKHIVVINVEIKIKSFYNLTLKYFFTTLLALGRDCIDKTSSSKGTSFDLLCTPPPHYKIHRLHNISLFVIIQ